MGIYKALSSKNNLNNLVYIYQYVLGSPLCYCRINAPEKYMSYIRKCPRNVGCD